MLAPYYLEETTIKNPREGKRCAGRHESGAVVQIHCHKCSLRWACLNVTVFYWQLFFLFFNVEPSVTLSLVVLHSLVLISWIQVPLLRAVIGPWTLIHSHFAPINFLRVGFLLSTCCFLGTVLAACFAAGEGSRVLSHNGNISVFWAQWETRLVLRVMWVKQNPFRGHCKYWFLMCREITCLGLANTGS